MDDHLKKAIEQMKNGEEKGFNEVYSATYNRVYFRAKQIMKKEEDAQDLTQIVFIEAYKNIHTLQVAEALYSWLDGITYNQGMKIYRKRKDVLLSEEAEGMFDVIESNDISSMPELTADQKATAEIVRGIIEELPELQKAAVVAYYFDGLKVEQIAEMMECSANTIKSRLNYARKYMKERVEEKEKKEGYRLHVLGVPVLWFAIRTMAEKTTLTAQAAQNVYNGACFNVGLQANAISAGGTAAAGVAGESVAGAVGESATGAVGESVAGATGGSAALVSGAAKTVGLGAKIASLSMAVKALMIAGAVAVVGTGIAGAASVLNDDQLGEFEDVSEDEEEEEDFDEEDEVVTEETEAEEEEEPIPEEPEEEQPLFELTEAAGKQISAFVAAAYQCNYFSVNNGNGWEIFSMTPDDCLFFVNDYIGMVNFRWNGGVDPDAGDLPYDWFHYRVTEKEFRDFYQYGLGIRIPPGYTFSYENEGGSLSISGGELRSTFDARTLQVADGDVEIVSQDESGIVLSGTCYWYDPEETVYQFTVSAVPSGNRDIFGGLTITDIQIGEGVADVAGNDYDYRLMAQQCVDVMGDLSRQGLLSEFDGYYLHDIDKDGIPEFILPKGTCNADYRFIVYGFDGMDLSEIGSSMWGYSLYGYPDEKAYAVEYVHMDYEIISYYDLHTERYLSNRGLQMTDDGSYTGGYEFPQGVYELTEYSDRDEAAVYQNIMSYVK